MCVGFWTLEHPEYALILCSNRDEYLSRPTTTAHFHSFEAHQDEHEGGSVLSGRDLRAGGTWLGLNRAGRVAFLTNITEEPAQYASSRGDLTASFLLPAPREESLGAHVDRLVHTNTPYAGFNVLLLEPTQGTGGTGAPLVYDAAYVTNHGGGGTVTSRPLTAAERRAGGLSNGVDGHGAEQWPKVQHGLGLFSAVLADAPDSEDALVARLFELLTWKSSEPPRARAELRNTIQIEPLLVSLPKAADGPFYGTRLSTVILVRRDGSVMFRERDIWSLDAESKIHKAERDDRIFRFQLDLATECIPVSE